MCNINVQLYSTLQLKTGGTLKHNAELNYFQLLPIKNQCLAILMPTFINSSYYRFSFEFGLNSKKQNKFNFKTVAQEGKQYL